METKEDYTCGPNIIEDAIRWVIITTDYELNLLDLDVEDINKYNEKHGCKLRFVQRSPTLMFKLDYRSGKWQPVKSDYDKKLLKTITDKKKEDRFCVFELPSTCIGKDGKTYEIADTGRKALHIIADIQDLEYCHVWSAYHLDFSSLRESIQAVFAKIDAEAG